ncbi:Ser/Thr protein kinase RdoA (MazF antagonist) [Litoreibacter meonggei]|uniref:Ser/Thr protein kinase RdoA (MazF antagonist) n=1 Tax=Litoreibacter meonggei TaxID=1049199 RepID=A0A497VKH2_9RHOB|nr:phosphotransferase [Litoreibacter meonggei]RLJ41168.1 Ser/Thr protein kinase RdoA (MazF antagonist) [Litoreibacter meonggei]
MTPEQATAKAILAAEVWGGLETPPRLIKNRENAVFEVRLIHGGHAALRLHRMGYQPKASIEGELIWTDRLRSVGFTCPAPIPTKDSQLTVELPDGQIASCVAWLDATPIGENGVAFAGSVQEHCALYHRVGRLIAQQHKATEAIDTSDIQRPAWDCEALLGDTPHWGRFWENPSLEPNEAVLLLEARDNAARHLAALNPTINLIHADLLQENILENEDGLWLIDFDDGGYGYRGYDFGTALIQHAELPYLDALSDATIEGYESLCGPQPSLAEALPLFIMLRSMASCGWTISRASADDPSQRRYAERALRCARHYLQTTTSMSS